MTSKGNTFFNRLRVLRWPLAVLLVAALSVFLLQGALKTGLRESFLRNGDWRTSESIGAADADAVVRAIVAIGGLLGSTREESMYYTLNSVAGEPLRLNCRYRIEGSDYDANWWSITAYGWDFYLIPNQEKRYSYNNENLIRGEDGRWVIRVGVSEQEGNWLPVGPSGTLAETNSMAHDFDLLLRLYTPGNAYLQHPESAPLPTVIKEACS
ncbi:DUF1214 domain-containing protein [Microbulbifer agarilyticus]|uniref:DUF1214 domain-containing protein n=1 Tax=Microbulbifer agarilyticus TaxID=260552 RepID=UPI001C93EF30|nr:DUF1214 domain-containing protein [Microbulbifer agarilyticus]MBY6188895.1 DUF1214 domain-containing protein [Microbulbifer agarilyticus]MBY6211984.1 DUF1214 domain-containing protein [Microbulbifer agarilyticus]MCA0901203.1 DUF1214 domain-containing protein [Microbulbifer agarilyticus]